MGSSGALLIWELDDLLRYSLGAQRCATSCGPSLWRTFLHETATVWALCVGKSACLGRSAGTISGKEGESLHTHSGAELMVVALNSSGARTRLPDRSGGCAHTTMVHG